MHDGCDELKRLAEELRMPLPRRVWYVPNDPVPYVVNFADPDRRAVAHPHADWAWEQIPIRMVELYWIEELNPYRPGCSQRCRVVRGWYGWETETNTLIVAGQPRAKIITFPEDWFSEQRAPACGGAVPCPPLPV